MLTIIHYSIAPVLAEITLSPHPPQRTLQPQQNPPLWT